MIKLRNIWFKYPRGSEVLKGVSMDVNEDIVIVMGPNGAGKTTLLKILACLYKPNKGEVIVNGINYWKSNSRDKLRVRRSIVYLHEKPVLFRGKVIDNVMYPLLIRGYSREEAEEEALKQLDLLGIRHLANRDRKQLSAGEAQMVAFARAISTNAQYIILDEPTSALDSERRKNLEEVLIRLRRDGRKIIIATHDRLFAVKLDAKIIEISDGQVRNILHSSELIWEIKNSIVENKLFKKT